MPRVVPAALLLALLALALPVEAVPPPPMVAPPRRPRRLAQAAASSASRPPPPALLPQVIRPDQTYYPVKGVLAAPSTAIVGPPLNVTATRAATIEECAATCRATPGCDWFWYCPSAGGCADGAGGSLPFQRCQLRGEACVLPALGLSSSTQVQVTSGGCRRSGAHRSCALRVHAAVRYACGVCPFDVPASLPHMPPPPRRLPRSARSPPPSPHHSPHLTAPLLPTRRRLPHHIRVWGTGVQIYGAAGPGHRGR